MLNTIDFASGAANLRSSQEGNLLFTKVSQYSDLKKPPLGGGFMGSIQAHTQRFNTRNIQTP